MQEANRNRHIPLVVDMTTVNGKSPRLSSEALNTLVLVEARDHDQACHFVQSNLDLHQLKPGTVNAVKLVASRRWWTFAVLL